MITAQEARALVETSKAKIDAVVERICEKIRELAEAGKNEYICGEDKLHDSASIFTSLTPPTRYQLAIIERLKSLGFDATWKSYGDSYVPRAYEDEPNQQRFKSWAVIVRW